MEIPWELERFDLEWRKGSRTRARDLAIEYIKPRYAQLAPLLAGRGVPELVSLVDQYREVGNEADRIVVDMWLIVGLAEAGAVAEAVGVVELGCEAPSALLEESLAQELRDLQVEWVADRREQIPHYALHTSNRYPIPLRAALGRLTIEELTKLTEQYRDAEDEVSALAVTYWILGNYDPQQITGTLQPVMRGAINRLFEKNG